MTQSLMSLSPAEMLDVHERRPDTLEQVYELIYICDEVLELPHGYHWHRPENEQAFLENAEGLCRAGRYGLNKQMAIYGNDIVDLYHKDRAELVSDLVGDVLHYQARRYAADTTPTGPFEELIEVDRNGRITVRKYWKYVPVMDYGQKMPLHALRALGVLEKYNVNPDALWVATYYEDIEVKDPLLCASFGRYVVSIAQWD
jgi:hypothetical protein